MEKSKSEETNTTSQTSENESNLPSNKEELISSNISKYKNSDSDSESDFDMDEERLTLIQVIKLIKNREKNKKKITFLGKKHSNPETNITYDKITKKLCNSFCPDYEELNTFLEKCKVTEILSNPLKSNNPEDKCYKVIFDPSEFMKKNNINKTILSFEDDICTYQNPKKNKEKEIGKEKEKGKEINPYYETKEIGPKLFMPRMTMGQLFMNFRLGYDNINNINDSTNEDFNEIIKILNTDILDKYQKNWLSEFIKKIADKPMNHVLIKNKKLEIILDLDLTCVFSFVNNANQSEALLYKELYPEKNIHVLSFEYQSKMMFSSVIIRKGLKDFVNYIKDICNFHIRTQGVLPYALKISEILAKNLDIEFKLVKSRESSRQDKICDKSFDDFEDENINSENSIIIDDSISAWKNDIANLIQSKKFIDKECGVYSQKEKEREKSSLDNELTRIQNCYSTFYYHKLQKSEKPSWKDQVICNEVRCPFYQFKDQNALNYNFVYSGEYLNSPKLQFVYLKKVIKEIYYMVYHFDMAIFEAIKLVRLSVFNGKLFYLKYLNNSQKMVLGEIIKVCGGEIIENPDDCIDFMIKNIFLVCSMQYYINERNSIQEELNNYKNYIIINERYILDSYYFMTDLGNRYKDNEYNPEKIFSL